MMVELDVLTRMKQALSKEHMVGAITLSHVDDDFYPVVMEYISSIDCEVGKVMFAKFKRSRVTKLLRLAGARTSVDSIEEFLAPEEKVLYNELFETVDKYWRLY
jgi:DNA replication initiation complex subunit (GINS family)